jgi:hypothetical protein
MHKACQHSLKDRTHVGLGTRKTSSLVLIRICKEYAPVEIGTERILTDHRAMCLLNDIDASDRKATRANSQRRVPWKPLARILQSNDSGVRIQNANASQDAGGNRAPRLIICERSPKYRWLVDLYVSRIDRELRLHTR